VSLLVAWPGVVPAQDPTDSRKVAESHSAIGTDVTYVTFGGAIDPWRLASLTLSRRGAWGSLFGRVNVANRFATTGTQFEVDAYPRLSANTYLYLNAGTSSSSVFPDNRIGAEFFSALPNAWEASAGFRRMVFAGDPVMLYTGAIGKYAGNYWFSLRPFIRFTSDKTSASAGLTVRRYTADANNYFGGRISYGNSPTDQVTPDAITRTQSFSLGLQGSSSLTARLLGTWVLSHDEEQLSATNTRHSWTATAGLKVTF